MKRRFTASFIVASLIGVFALAFDSTYAWAEPKVITVPANGSDPSLPHLAYNGHPTTLKAVARGIWSGSAPVTYRWDTNGDGSFEDEVEQFARQCMSSGTVYDITCYDLGYTFTLPAQTANKLFVANIRLRVTGFPDTYASYPIYVRADVPAQPAGNATALPQNATDEQLEVMRAVALDDALWYLHKQMLQRSGTGAGILGRITGSGYTGEATTGAALFLFERSGHLPAYPPETYDHDINAQGQPRPAEPPAEFSSTNDVRYNTDPYAEDAVRAFNFLLLSMAPASVTSIDEADDGNVAIAGTNDGIGLAPYVAGGINQFGGMGLPMAGIAGSGLAGTVAQVGHTTYVKGRPVEYIVQQSVDYLALLQTDTGGAFNYGGWYYSPNTSIGWNHEDFIRSAFIALEAASSMQPAGVYVNNRLRDRAASYFKWNQDPLSKLAWWAPSSCSGTGNFAETGDSLIGMGYLGWSSFNLGDPAILTPIAGGVLLTKGQARQIFNDYLYAVGTRWVSFQSDCVGWASGLFFNDNGTNTTPYLRTDSKGNILAIFGLAEALSKLPNSSDFSTLNGHNWKREFSTYMIRNQYSDGHWLDNYWPSGVLVGPTYYGPALNTAYAALTLTPNLLLNHPVALGTASPTVVTEGCSGESNGKVTFNHSSSFPGEANRQIVEYRWDFDADSGVAIDWNSIPMNDYSADLKAWRGSDRNAAPSYVYQSAGNYRVSLRVLDNNNPAKTDEFVTHVTVQGFPNVAPIADAGGPYTLDVGNGITLNGAGSSDPNAACGDSIAYGWDLNNDGVFTDATGSMPSLSAAQLSAIGLGSAGTRSIWLRVTDIFGAADTASTTMTFYNNQPFALLSASQSNVGCNQQVNFDASGSYQSRPDRSIVSYEWDFDYNAGAGFQTDASGTPTTSHAYLALGQHATAVRVTDSNVPPKTAIATVSTSVNYANLPPVASAGGPYTVPLGQPVTLNGTASHDPNAPCDSIVNYQWTIGPFALSGAIPQFTAAQVNALGAGIHFVELTVMDNFGEMKSATTTLTITASCVDTDGDGICDSDDNCPSIANASQADSNANGIGDACEIPIYRLTGTAYIFPETTLYRATFSLDVLSGAVPTGSLKYYYGKTRMNFVSTRITSVNVTGNTGTVAGTGMLNGAAGYTFTAAVTDGAPDRFGIAIFRPDGSAYYTAAPIAAGGGNLLIQTQ